LSETDDERVPSTSLRKNELVLAGLGERNVTITDVNCTPKDFQEALLTEFPRLRQGGGFELLRCAASTRQLEIIPFKISNSPRLLKPWIGTARIYIRPIQLNLDVTPTEVEEEEVGNVTQLPSYSVYDSIRCRVYDRSVSYVRSSYRWQCCVSI